MSFKRVAVERIHPILSFSIMQLKRFSMGEPGKLSERLDLANCPSGAIFIETLLDNPPMQKIGFYRLSYR